MNQLINTHYSSIDQGLNEYRIYECSKKKGNVKYIAVIHSSNLEELPDEKILLGKVPCAVPQSWAINMIKTLDSKLSRLQLLSNSDLNYLVFSATHKDYVSKKVEEIIFEFNEIYLSTKS